MLTRTSLLHKAWGGQFMVVLGRSELWVAAVGWWWVARQGGVVLGA
jgi:hypothetical protein